MVFKLCPDECGDVTYGRDNIGMKQQDLGLTKPLQRLRRVRERRPVTGINFSVANERNGKVIAMRDTQVTFHEEGTRREWRGAMPPRCRPRSHPTPCQWSLFIRLQTARCGSVSEVRGVTAAVAS